jgi:hypothetical protein
MSSLCYDVLIISSVMWANVKWFAEPGCVAEDESPAAAQVRLLRRLSKYSRETLNQRFFKYGSRSPKFIWAPCHVMCTAVLIGWGPATLPPHLGSYKGAMLSKDRRHLFVIPCSKYSGFWNSKTGVGGKCCVSSCSAPSLTSLLWCKNL